MTKRPTDEIRRACGIVEGMRDNEFAEITVRKAAVAEACDRLDEAVGAVRQDAWDEGFEAGRQRSIEDREAAEWVRDHDGLDAVKEEWKRRSNLKRMCEKEKAKVERQQRHIEFVQGKCHERQGHIVELSKELAELRKVLSDYRDALGGMCERLGITDGTSLPEMPDVICEALDRRLMPEGIEWPTVDGSKVDFKTPYQPSLGVLEAVSIYSNGACEVMSHDGIIKPVSEIHVVVLAADGEPLEVGQTVWSVNDGTEYKVGEIRDTTDEDDDPCKIIRCSNDELHIYCAYLPPEKLTHQCPVLDADGVPIHEGDTVWCVATDDEFEDMGILTGKDKVRQRLTVRGTFFGGCEPWADFCETSYSVRACYLTHAKPEPKRFCRDCAHWQKDPIADNMGVCWFLYHEYEGQDCYSARLSDIGACEEFMPSARALAERERGE